MGLLGIHSNENLLYSPYNDDCWVVLAKEIMASYAVKYMCQIPTKASTQEEYDRIDKRTYLPIRRSILRNVKDGPLRNVTNIDAIYCAFESKRLQYKKSLGIIWEEPYHDEITGF